MAHTLTPAHLIELKRIDDVLNKPCYRLSLAITVKEGDTALPVVTVRWATSPYYGAPVWVGPLAGLRDFFAGLECARALRIYGPGSYYKAHARSTTTSTTEGK